jgi:hypothetical protein
MNNIAIIILTWNGLSLTKRCLDSLFKAELPTGTDIIVVDNGSADGTVEYLKNIENVQLIENKKNLGYSKAVNIGIKTVPNGTDIVLLNNDTEIIEKDWLKKLQIQAYSDEKIGVAGVKILKDDGIIQHCGAYIPIDTYWGQQTAGGQVDINQYDEIYDVESVVFACVYIKEQVIRKIGLLCEDFFAYFEDTDYCLRASKEGFKVVMCGSIRILHSENSSTKINKVSFSNIFLKSQDIFKKKWSHEFENERYTTAIGWHSIINFPTGYAGTSRSIVQALDKNKTRVSYKYVYGAGTVFPVEEPIHTDSYLVNCVRSRKFGEAPIQVVYAQADVFEKNNGKVKVGYSMLEVTGLPLEWVRQANLMDEVWVPSQFNKDTFQESGVKVPIYIIPLGIDPAYFSPTIYSNKLKNTFTFLSNFEWGERKAPEVLLRAFSDEFSTAESVALVCKVNNFDGSVNVHREIDNLRLRKNGGRIVIAENAILQSYDLGALYASADCFVLPTRGEGWGMPILEAMACGLPVIATNWSAQTDFMKESNAYPLEVESLIPATAKCPYYEGFKWAQPSYEHLRYLMRWVFENQQEASAKGLKAASEVRNNWTWNNTANVIKNRINILS